MPERECVICGGDVEEADIEPDKVERLKEDNKHLEGEEIHKLVCQECGHTSYVRKD
ncbi:MAG: hypothetical protein SVU32_04905 [Candidatus Nanohaloarchaea archaeon]|nr:hypothetical protein [Candidatus Nanohaloarchaea archaeon]